jgi:hypothetical protein
MEKREHALDPAELLSRFRRSYRNYYALWTQTGRVPDGVTLVTPEKFGLGFERMPEGARRALEAYQEQAGRVTLLKYLRIVDGEPELVVEDESELPPEEQLVTVSETVTLNSADLVHVVTDIFVARRE